MNTTPNNKARIAVVLLALSAAGFGTWKQSEGFVDKAMIPTKGDVPTIGLGSTKYESGAPVKLGDTITRPRAEELARNLLRQDEKRFADTVPGVLLYQDEYDVYVDFIGQYGIGNWRASTMRKKLLVGDYRAACDALLNFRKAAGFDCSTPGNSRCWGVWTRQLARHDKCLGAA